MDTDHKNLMFFQVSDGNAGKITHVVFCFVSPLYIPFGIVYFIKYEKL